MQKLRVETAAMKRDAEHYSRPVNSCFCPYGGVKEHVELEKRYRELTDLLYYKQTQLEAMASEKAAAAFQLEKEAKRLQEVQLEAERNRSSRRASSSWEEDTDIKALEYVTIKNLLYAFGRHLPLPLHHRHMTRATIQLQKAAKLLDSGAVRATRFLWRCPTARVILLFYLVRTDHLLWKNLSVCPFVLDVSLASPSESPGVNSPIDMTLVDFREERSRGGPPEPPESHE
uniref:Uncharacterized protein n=1 Tax=Solanum lycopersicum TaxID=4081 RepID=A0A3Q7J3B4_SOLLC